MDIGLILSTIGAVLLFLTSIIHIVKGYPRLTEAINTGKISLPSFSADTRKTISHEELCVMWLSFGIHLLIISVILGWLIFSEIPQKNKIITLLTAIPIMDAFLMKIKIKATHAGIPLLTLAGLLIITGQFI